MVLNLRRSCAPAATLVAVLAGCGDAPGGDESADLVATTTVWADITTNVACGEAVTAVIPPNADPHSFEPSLRDRALLEHADLVVANGGRLEEGVDELFDVADANVVEMSTRIDLIESEHGHEHGDDDDPDDEHDHTNPHVWHDPTRVAGALDLIADALIASGRDATEIRKCADSYRSELAAADAEIAGLLAQIPLQLRVIVSNHDSLAYFADRYDLEVVGSVLPSSSTMAETNAADLEALAQLIAERNVPVIFVDESSSAVDAASLADRAGVDVVPLLTGSLSGEGPSSTYIGMLRSNAVAVSEALVP